MPLENPLFQGVSKTRRVPARTQPGQNASKPKSAALTLGKAEFLTLPGEVLPNIGLYLKRKMRGEPKFLLGLTGDELGYILTPEDYGLPLYRYETQVSVGSQVGALMEKNLLDLMQAK